MFPELDYKDLNLFTLLIPYVKPEPLYNYSEVTPEITPNLTSPYPSLFLGHLSHPNDMTMYIERPDLRATHSRYMAKMFDKWWRDFKNSDDNRDGDFPDVKFSEAFHGVRRCLQFLKTPKQIFDYYFTLIDIERPTCTDEILETSLQTVIPFFSWVKRHIHVEMDNLPPIAYCYSELDTIAGYPRQEHRSMTDDPKLWLTEDVPDLHDSKWWQSHLLKVFYDSYRPNGERLISFFEFLRRPWLWVTSGASSKSKLFLGDKKIRTKFGAAVSLSTNELLACVVHAVNPRSKNISIFIKPDERGFKRRLIANMDLGSYLVAAYIRYLIEWFCGVEPKFMTATTSATKDLKVIQLLRLAKRAIPLDESQFDHHVSRASWIGFINMLNQVFPKNFGVHLFATLFANSFYYDIESKNVGPWRKGMPSGLALTSIGNSLFNYTKQMAIISPIHFALGDDALLFNEELTLKDIEQYYATYGSEVNHKKNWDSNNYAEFLHFLYCKHGRVGYPARMYGSLMYALQFKDVTELQRLHELATMWKDFFDRACCPIKLDLVASDLSRAVSRRWAGFNKQSALQWLHIPKALNGFGFLPYLPMAFKVTNERQEVQHYYGSLFSLPPVVTTHATKYQFTKFKLSNAQYTLGNTLKLPQIETLDDWIDRMNLKCKGYTRTQVEFATATIPLPEIPFISSTRMSGFASLFKFNAYPNAHGSVVARTTRFIRASYALVESVLDYCQMHKILVYV